MVRKVDPVVGHDVCQSIVKRRATRSQSLNIVKGVGNFRGMVGTQVRLCSTGRLMCKVIKVGGLPNMSSQICPGHHIPAKGRVTKTGEH